MFQSKIKNRIYLALVAMSLAAGNVLAEDDAVDIDPNSPFVDVVRDLWGFLAQFFA